MNRIRLPFQLTAAPAWRLALMLGMACGAACPQAASAQTGPLPSSPTVPTAYQSPNFHAGGAPGIPPAAATTPYTNTLNQLQGTPSGYLLQAGILAPTQIPSFLLGDYNPAFPPSGPGVYYPEHFADGDVYAWAAPFDYTPAATSTVTVDDSQTTATAAGDVFVATGFQAEPPTGNTNPDPAAGTAANGEYVRLPPGTQSAPVNGTATWTLVAAASGNFSVYFHIPDNLPDSTGTIESRSTAVQYSIVTSGTFAESVTATASQTEANSVQYLAGPFQLAVGDTVTVRLNRNTAFADATLPTTTVKAVQALNQENVTNYLIADSMTLQSAIGDVRSTPTAINYESYPKDFQRAVYWGIYTPTGAASVVVGSTQAVGAGPGQNAIPDTGNPAGTGTPILRSGATDTNDPTNANPVHADAIHRIRQLVYFGRSEPAANSQVIVDDSSATNFSDTPAVNWAAITDATATTGEYVRTAPTSGASSATAQWTLTAPNAGSYFLTAHLPQVGTSDGRITDATYTVQVNAGTIQTITPISQIPAGGGSSDVLLPTGPLALAKGDVVKVILQNNTGNAITATTHVLADSVTMSTGNGQGAIYCVDGFTGGVVWRFETPASPRNGPSAPVFSSPAVARINVMVNPGDPNATPTPIPPTYDNRLVVIVGDNNGMVYCLDAIGNADGTSNNLALTSMPDPVTPTQTDYGSPIYAPQPGYGAPKPAGITPGTARTNPHVGTTGVYWMYRPDATLPKDLTTGTARVTPATATITTNPTTGLVEVNPTTGTSVAMPDRDLPVPGAFGPASPSIFVDPAVTPLPAPTPAGSPAAIHNANVYVGNGNGVLYALDATGTRVDDTNAAKFAASGDTFNVPLDIRRQPGVYKQTSGGAANPAYDPTDAAVPDCQPLWWFTLRGETPNSGAVATYADIESAPAINVTYAPPVAPATVGTFTPTVYVGSAHEQESTSNVGRLYALNGLYGPSGNSGKSSPLTQPNAGVANYTGPGSPNYNVAQRPQISPTDTADWSFPDAYGTDTYTTGKSSNQKPRPALGNLTGSPVVFTDTNETGANADGTSSKTRIYFAANSGLEVPKGTTATVAPTVRPDANATGRIWAVNLDGSVGTTTGTSGATAHVWSFPQANDPNDATKDKTAEPFAPIGAFQSVTPAIGYVQFPNVIKNGDGSSYKHTDVIRTFGDGTAAAAPAIPMLYAATAGVNDTALYAVDIDGDMDGSQATTSATYDQRIIYRQISPDGAIFQSSPILITNSGNEGTNAGNGGSILVVGGNTLYDFSATPVSNPIATDAAGNPENYPLIREDRAFVGFGPLSSPAVAATNVYDPTNPTDSLAFTVTPTTNVVTDWVYVGDSSTGLCRGITPNDPTDGDIPDDLGDLVPVSVEPAVPVDLTAILRTYLVDDAHAGSTNYADRLPVGAALPVYEWGQNVYIRIANVVPPNPTDDPLKYVHDENADLASASPSSPITFYTNPTDPTYVAPNSVTYTLSDATPSGNIDSGPISVDSGSIPAATPTVPTSALTPLPNGFYVRPSMDAAKDLAGENNLVDGSSNKWIAASTYFIGDGTARKNTPGARRRVQEATQAVSIRLYIGGPLDALSSYQTPTTTATSAILRATATNGNQVSVPVRNASGVITGYTFTGGAVRPADQPTFGILNPIGVRGGGVPLPLLASGFPTAATEIGDELGPFRGAGPPPYTDLTGTFHSGDNYTLQALTNGNGVYQTAAPPSTSGTGNPTILPLVGDANDPNVIPQTVVTSTGLIPHNSGGDNLDNSPFAPPTGLHATGSAVDPKDGLQIPAGQTAANFGSQDRPYALDLFDRSALAIATNSAGTSTTVAPRSLRLKSGGASDTGGTSGAGGVGMSWNDNSQNTQLLTTDHDAVVNYLPWETAPTPYRIGVNTSPDYPDIGPQNVALTLHADDNAGGSSASLSSDGAVATPATPSSGSAAGTDVLHRYVYATPVQVHVNVPHYQPANQQLYRVSSAGAAYTSAGEVGPQQIVSTSDQVFPMGYVTTQRIYVPNASGRYQPGCAYRDVRIYTGVPVSMSTSIADGTIDIGKVPSSFGIQTSQFTSPPTGVAPLGPFTPYTPAFQPYFLPVTVHNDGNVNLLNVHLDQKVIVNGVPQTIQMQSDRWTHFRLSRPTTRTTRPARARPPSRHGMPPVPACPSCPSLSAPRWILTWRRPTGETRSSRWTRRSAPTTQARRSTRLCLAVAHPAR